jgi:predicted RNase H-like HicB family nuclease
MQIPVAIEPTKMGGFRAQSVSPLAVVAEGSTREEAVSKVQAELNRQLQEGKEVVMVEVGTAAENPWLKMAGRLKDDPLFDEWRAEVEAYRRQCDVEAGVEYRERP